MGLSVGRMHTAISCGGGPSLQKWRSTPASILSHQARAPRNARGSARHTPPASFWKWKSHKSSTLTARDSSLFHRRRTTTLSLEQPAVSDSHFCLIYFEIVADFLCRGGILFIAIPIKWAVQYADMFTALGWIAIRPDRGEAVVPAP